MKTGVFQKAGITRIAVAGFPEGNPNISESVLEEALVNKVSFARAAGLQLSMVTQFCFKAEPIVHWLQRVRALGIENPVRVGLAGPAGLVTLARYPGRVYSRFELVNHVQGYDFDGYERTIDVHVKNLRKKIEPDPAHPEYIETVFGVGYRISESPRGDA